MTLLDYIHDIMAELDCDYDTAAEIASERIYEAQEVAGEVGRQQDRT